MFLITLLMVSIIDHQKREIEYIPDFCLSRRASDLVPNYTRTVTN